jgi:hypothetical protein
MNTRLMLSLVVIVVLLTSVGGATAHVGAPAPAASQSFLDASLSDHFITPPLNFFSPGAPPVQGPDNSLGHQVLR